MVWSWIGPLLIPNILYRDEVKYKLYSCVKPSQRFSFTHINYGFHTAVISFLCYTYVDGRTDNIKYSVLLIS